MTFAVGIDGAALRMGRRMAQRMALRMEVRIKPEIRAAADKEPPPDPAQFEVGLLPRDEYIVTGGEYAGSAASSPAMRAARSPASTWPGSWPAVSSGTAGAGWAGLTGRLGVRCAGIGASLVRWTHWPHRSQLHQDVGKQVGTSFTAAPGDTLSRAGGSARESEAGREGQVCGEGQGGEGQGGQVSWTQAPVTRRRASWAG